MNSKPLGAFAAISQSLLDLIARLVSLLAFESKGMAVDLLWMFGLVISAAGLAITGWLVLLACLVMTLVHSGVIGWVGALALAAAGSFVGVALLVALILRWRRHPVFSATLRQLAPETAGTDDAINPASTLGRAEQAVIAARSAVLGEYHLAEARLEQQIASPPVLVGVFVAALGVGYLSARPGQSRGPRWRAGLGAAQVLLPLWLAVQVAIKPAEK